MDEQEWRQYAHEMNELIAARDVKGLMRLSGMSRRGAEQMIVFTENGGCTGNGLGLDFEPGETIASILGRPERRSRAAS